MRTAKLPNTQLIANQVSVLLDTIKRMHTFKETHMKKSYVTYIEAMVIVKELKFVITPSVIIWVSDDSKMYTFDEFKLLYEVYQQARTFMSKNNIDMGFVNQPSHQSYSTTLLLIACGKTDNGYCTDINSIIKLMSVGCNSLQFTTDLDTNYKLAFNVISGDYKEVEVRLLLHESLTDGSIFNTLRNVIRIVPEVSRKLINSLDEGTLIKLRVCI